MPISRTPIRNLAALLPKGHPATRAEPIEVAQFGR
jgi:hypothetical protein